MGHRYLVTGGAGFIGSNFIRWILDRDRDAHVTNLDAMTYAGIQATVDELEQYQGHEFVRGDIRDVDLLAEVVPNHDVVVNFAAESHVDRSIGGPDAFLDTNVVGTGRLLEAAYRSGVPRFIHVSTDEVYGSVAEGFASETARLKPSSPYSSSKAGSDLLVRSYHHTYGYDTVVTRCANNYGPYQFPEKVIPLFITNLLEGGTVPLYGDGRNERDWIHVADHCSAIDHVTRKGEPGGVYNIGANAQMSNLELTRLILETMDRDESSIEYVEDRMGHDLRYAIDSSKVRDLGWVPEHTLADGLVATIEWYTHNTHWWKPLKEAT